MRRGCSNTLGAGSRTSLRERQDNRGILRLGPHVKFQPASVGEARPARCPRCERGAYEGGRTNLHGHGVVERQQRGPPEPGAAPSCVVVPVRRFRCIGCKKVLRVVPASCVARKHFSGAAIAFALALWGGCGRSAAETRRRTSDWQVLGAGARGWRSLWRWSRAVARGELLAGLGLSGLPAALREVARRAAQALCGHAPVGLRREPIESQAFHGASHVS